MAMPIGRPWLSVSELHLHCVSRLAYQYGSLRKRTILIDLRPSFQKLLPTVSDVLPL